MKIDKNGEYIVKAKDVSFYKNTQQVQLVVAGLVCIFDIFILIQFITNHWVTMGVIIFIIILGLAVVLTKMKNSILIKDKKIYIERYLKKYEIDYCDLIRVKKQIEIDNDQRGRPIKNCFLVIEYFCENKIAMIKDNFGATEAEIDKLCSCFITNKELELIDNINEENNFGGFDENDKLRMKKRLNEEYFDIERRINTDEIENIVYNYDITQKKLKVIVVIVAVIILLIMFLWVLKK